MAKISLIKSNQCPAVALRCVTPAKKCDSGRRQRQGCKSGAVVWNAAHVRTRSSCSYERPLKDDDNNSMHNHLTSLLSHVNRSTIGSGFGFVLASPQ